MPRVILVERNERYDVSSATTFGEILYLCDRPVNPFNTVGAVELFQERLVQMEYDPEVDYLCMTGQSLTVAMLLGVAVKLYGRVRLLMFHAREREYRERFFAVGGGV